MTYSTGNSHIAVGDPDEGDREEHVAVRAGSAREAPRLHPPAVAARSSGHLLRGQRHADDAAPNAGVWRAVFERRAGRAGTQQIVSEQFVEDSFEPRGRSRISGREYGYGWWIREMAGRKAWYAWGFGGQFIVLVPSLDLVVVSTSAATVSDDRREHRRTVDDIIEHLVIAPLAGAN